MAYVGKESKRVDICICITDTLCCTPETNTTFKISYTAIKILKIKNNNFMVVVVSAKGDKVNLNRQTKEALILSEVFYIL